MTVLSLGPALALGLGTFVTRAAEPVARIKLATLAPKGSSFHQVLLEMGEKWRQAPGGGVALTLFTDGTMGGEADMVRKMRFGQLQAAALTAVGLGDIDRSVSALQVMPMIFRSWEEMDYVLDKLTPQLEKKFEDKGFVVLFWTYAGWVRFFSKEPAARPEDFKRMKLFAWAGGTAEQDLMKSLGYHPVPLETADILPGLQTGLINAVPTIPVFANAAQFYSQAPHMLDLNWAPIVGGAVVSRKAWDKLPPATQAALRKAALEAGLRMKQRSEKENAEAVEAMKKRGLKVNPATPEIEREWRQIAESIYPTIRGKLVPADMFDEVRRLLREFRAASAQVTP
jgi:TRAP-type C4-dicarboxylate transport system substrate-binding protein